MNLKSHPSLKLSFMLFWTLAILLALSFVAIYVEVVVLKGSVSENSPIEWLEEGSILLISGLFYNIARKYENMRQLGVLVGSFFLCMFIREIDGVLDQIHHGAWKYPAWAVAITACSYAAKNMTKSLEQLEKYTQHPSFGVMLAGMVSLLVFSRLFGMSIVWETMMGDSYIRDVKNLVEEGVELMCYTLMLGSTVWYWLAAKRFLTSEKSL